MIRIEGSGATYGDVWFEEEPPADCKVDIVRYHCRSTPVANARNAPFVSMVTDLSVEADAIAESFSKDCRYKIRRAHGRDELSLECVMDPLPRLDEFCAFFDAFARQKAHEPSDRSFLLAAHAAGQLMLARAACRGETLVWHAYLLCGNTSWLQYSGSCFRNQDKEHRALIGRANRWLHWQAMLHFKALGLLRYDWGGLFQDESTPDHAGINGFKRSFGGSVERTFNCTVPITVRGRLYLPLRAAWHSGRTALPFRKVSAASA